MSYHSVGADHNWLSDSEQCTLSFHCCVELILLFTHSLKLLYYLSRITVPSSEVRDSCIHEVVSKMCPQTSAASIFKTEWHFCITRTPQKHWRAGAIGLVLTFLASAPHFFLWCLIMCSIPGAVITLQCICAQQNIHNWLWISVKQILVNLICCNVWNCRKLKRR